MKRFRITALVIILMMLVASYFYPDILLLALIEDPYLPFGNLLAWLAIISFAILPWLSSDELRSGRTMYFLVLRFVTFIVSGLAFLWPFVGRYLAGNWHNSFSSAATGFTGSPEAGFFFWRYTGLIVMLPILVFVMIWGQYLARKL